LIDGRRALSKGFDRLGNALLPWSVEIDLSDRMSFLVSQILQVPPLVFQSEALQQINRWVTEKRPFDLFSRFREAESGGVVASEKIGYIRRGKHVVKSPELQSCKRIIQNLGGAKPENDLGGFNLDLLIDNLQL
jgi:hypothetical protein